MLDNAQFRVTITESSSPDTADIEVTNRTSVPVHLGLGATMNNPSTVDLLWQSTVEVLQEETQEVVEPGQSYVHFLPMFAGVKYVVYQDIDTTPVAIAQYTQPGNFAPASFTGSEAAGYALQIGPQLVVGSGLARAGERVHLASDWLYSASVNVYLLAEQEALDGALGSFGEIWSLPGGSVPVGTYPVVANKLSADLLLPSGLVPGAYALIAVGAGTVSAGPTLVFSPDGSYNGAHNLVIEAGPPRGSVTTSATPVTVAPIDQYGHSPASFTFPTVTSAGEVTVSTSTSGPTPTGFSLNNATYYEIASTAGFSGAATVCISYDTSPWVEVDGLWQALALYHYSAGAWQNITTSSTFGQVCGATTSFSPFAIGIPSAPPVWPFEGFLSPVSSTAVNTEFAGLVVPFRFRLGGDKGLGVFNGSPVSQRVNCTTKAPIGAPQAAASALRTELTYVKGSKTYWYFWDTSEAWAGTCRTFTMTFDDGTSHSATFSFKKFSLGKLIKSIIKAY